MGSRQSANLPRVPHLLLSAALLSLFAAAPVAGQTSSFDHSLFDRLLNTHVSADGMVDYDAFARAPAFDRYLRQLVVADVESLPRDEQLALWINAYNAYTIRLINDHEERRSIRRIGRTLGLVQTGGAWRIRMAEVGGQTYSLDEIEHEIIRPRFREPRIHFALVCAAMGCPPLRREAYTGTRLDDQLDDQARQFLLRAPDKNRIDVESRTLYLSRIFDWYAEDFGGSREAIGRYVAGFLPPGSERDMLRSTIFQIRHTDYDWTLNSRELANR